MIRPAPTLACTRLVLLFLLVAPNHGRAAAEPAPQPYQPGPCVASGHGRDYLVGPEQPFTRLDDVPWEQLRPGDTVRLLPRPEPYRGKFILSAEGTAAAPVRICGVRAADGARPVIDGRDATTRAALAPVYGRNPRSQAAHQDQAVIMIRQAGAEWTRTPRHIQIDGLAIRGAYPTHRYISAGGTPRQYGSFNACLWIERGHHIRIADNEISDCGNAIFSKSLDEGAFAQTRHLHVVGNHLHGNGYTGDSENPANRLHTTYLQGVDVLVEFNHYGPLRAGAGGNAIKDRSAGLVVRYNRIEGGAHSLDLVEAEDMPNTALAEPSYRATFVYGNQIFNDDRARAIVHYGGDHFGSKPKADWGEPIFRKGTLYFFHNTVIGRGQRGRIFRVSTTEEMVDAWNNIFWFETAPQVRESENPDVARPWTSDGPIRLGRNWLNSRWQEADPNRASRIDGVKLQLVGPAAPIDLDTLVPTARSAALDASLHSPDAARSHPVQFQLGADLKPVLRLVRGKAMDLGALER